jgi:long-chain fatty acid transport protein
MRSHAAFKMLSAATLLALALCPAAALASGFQLVEQNGSGLGNAFSGQAAGVKDASAVFFNPAALTGLEGGQLIISVEPIIPSQTFADTGSAPPYLPTTLLPIPLGSDGGDAGGLTPVPNAYFSYQAGDTLWLGLGVNVPFGLTTEWDADWTGRFHGVKSSIQTINVNPTVAVKLGALSLGAGISWQRLDAELTQNVAYGGASVGAAYQAGGEAAAAGILAQLGGPAGLGLEGLAVIDGDSTSWGGKAGALLAVGEGGKLGVSYRSTVKHDLEGTVTFNASPSFMEEGPLGPLGAGLNARFADGAVVAEVDLPDTLSVAAAWEGESVEVLLDWTWTGWSSIESLDVLRDSGSEVSSVALNVEDTWRAGLGLNYKLSNAWKLRLGTAYDKTPVQDAYRTPRLPDNDRVWAAGGLEWKLNERNRIDVGYAHLFIDDAPSNLIDDFLSGSLVGAYTSDVNILGLQYTLSF